MIILSGDFTPFPAFPPTLPPLGIWAHVHCCRHSVSYQEVTREKETENELFFSSLAAWGSVLMEVRGGTSQVT